MAIEFELKFCATPEVLAQIAASVTGDIRHYNMETVYYDTPGRELSRRHCTLRRRMENDTSVCTLKMPAGGISRAEFELERDDIRSAIPELCKLSNFPELEAFAREGLLEVCGARFHRQAVTLDLGDTVLELALDEGVLLGGGREIPLCELEVELKSGTKEAAATYAKALALRYGLKAEHQSKFRRASILAEGEQNG